jgi:hypothetical protein
VNIYIQFYGTRQGFLTFASQMMNKFQCPLEGKAGVLVINNCEGRKT